MYAIVLHEDVAVDPREHAALVAKHLGLTAVEAKMMIRRGRGILLDQLSETAATEIAASLAAHGVRATAVAKDRLPELPAPRKVAKIERGAETFTYRILGTDETGVVPWDAVAIVSCGLIARAQGGLDAGFDALPAFHRVEESDRILLRENLILKMDQSPEKREVSASERGKSVFERLETSKDARVILDLVTEDHGTWLRISMDEFGFVPSEGAVQLGSSWGLDALMKDLRSRAAAAFTDLTLRILASDDVAPLLLAQTEELNRYTTWAILRRHLGLEPEIPWAERDEPGEENREQIRES
jgi:hypothetical protein